MSLAVAPDQVAVAPWAAEAAELSAVVVELSGVAALGQDPLPYLHHSCTDAPSPSDPVPLIRLPCSTWRAKIRRPGWSCRANNAEYTSRLRLFPP